LSILCTGTQKRSDLLDYCNTSHRESVWSRDRCGYPKERESQDPRPCREDDLLGLYKSGREGQSLAAGSRQPTGRVPAAGLLHTDDSRHCAAAINQPRPKTEDVVCQPLDEILAVGLKHTHAMGA
jgi:hypothetical protein